MSKFGRDIWQPQTHEEFVFIILVISSSNKLIFTWILSDSTEQQRFPDPEPKSFRFYMDDFYKVQEPFATAKSLLFVSDPCDCWIGANNGTNNSHSHD